MPGKFHLRGRCIGCEFGFDPVQVVAVSLTFNYQSPPLFCCLQILNTITDVLEEIAQVRHGKRSLTVKHRIVRKNPQNPFNLSYTFTLTPRGKSASAGFWIMLGFYRESKVSAKSPSMKSEKVPRKINQCKLGESFRGFAFPTSNWDWPGYARSASFNIMRLRDEAIHIFASFSSLPLMFHFKLK